MWDVRACRCCLSTSGKLESMSDAYKRIYATISGLEITVGDGYPTYLCVECSTQFKKIFAFRRKCRRAFFVMKEIMIIKKQVSLNDITTVDRNKTNLASPYSLSTPETSACYCITTEIQETDPDYNLDIKSEPPQSEWKFNIEIKLKETQTPENLNELVKYTPDVRSNSFIVTDIKPANYKEIERLEQEKELELRKLEMEDETFDQEEIFNDVGDVDLDDVFKDLVEEDRASESEKEEELALPFPDLKALETKKKKEKTIDINKDKEEVQEQSKALDNAEIKVLSIVEQRKILKRRMYLEPFKSAIYKCAMCVRPFKTLNILMKHVNIHNKNLSKFKFSCAVCKNRFKTELRLQIHIAETHQYEYTCKICENTHFTLKSLVACYNQHKSSKEQRKDPDINLELYYIKASLMPDQMHQTMRGAVFGKKRVCNKCNMCFETLVLLRNHGIKHYEPSSGPKYKCDICNTYFLLFCLLERHMDLWHLYSYTCKECHYVCMNRAEAIAHKKSHNNFICEYCGRKYRSAMAYFNHTRTVHNTQAYHCPQCTHTSMSKQRLYSHQLYDHGFVVINDPKLGDPDNRCVHCDVQFVDQSTYYLHLLKERHKEAANVELGCRTCMKLFDSREELESHTSQAHAMSTSLYPKQCKYCDEMLQDGKHNVAHYAKEHPGLEYMPVSEIRLCELCGKSVPRFSIQKHKQYHIKGIDAKEIHHCKYCSSKLPNAKIFISHVLCHHTHKPYHCAVCKMQFNHRFNCRDHILKVHAPEMPYKCEFCGRRFAHLDYLNDHSVKAHDVNVKKIISAKHTYLSKKMKGRIYVYPLMKIDGTLIGTEVLDKVQIEICDYMDENSKPLEDYKDFVILDNIQNPVVSTGPKPPGAKKMKKKDNYAYKRKIDGSLYDQDVRKKLKLDKSLITSEITEETVIRNDDRHFKIKGLKDYTEDKYEIVKFDEENFNIKIADIKPRDEESSHLKIEERSTDFEYNTVGGEDVSQNEVTEEMVSDETFDEKYEVIEQDGEQFVMIDGVLYKIEAAD